MAERSAAERAADARFVENLSAVSFTNKRARDLFSRARSLYDKGHVKADELAFLHGVFTRGAGLTKKYLDEIEGAIRRGEVSAEEVTFCPQKPTIH